MKRRTGLLGMILCALLWKTSAQAGEGYFYDEGTIWRAAQDGDLAKVKKMLAAKPRLLNSRATGYFKDTLLEAAAHGGSGPVFRYLLGRGATLTKDQIMLHAAAGRNLEIVKLVAAKGAQINARQTRFGDTPLMWAAQDHGRLEVLKFLVSRGADVKAKSKSGETAIMYATLPAAATSTNYGPKPKNKLAAVRYLLSKGANVNEQNKYGTSCLSRAIEYPGTAAGGAESEQLTQFLLSKGANPNSRPEPILNNVANYEISQARTPGQLKSGLKKLMLLLQYKADPNMRDTRGEAALHVLFEYYGSGYGPKDTPTETEIVMLATKALLKAGADPDLKDNKGKSPRDMVREVKGRWALAPLFGTKTETIPAPIGSEPITAPSTIMKPGEISLTGSVILVDAASNKVIINSTRFLLPNGKSASLAVPKEKTVIASDTTFIYAIGKPTKKMALTEIKSKLKITVIGPDDGAGSELRAREIIIGRE